MTSIRERIAGLAEEGLSDRAIARRLGVAPATVGYHRRRVTPGHTELSAPSLPSVVVTSQSLATQQPAPSTRTRVVELLDVRQCIKAFGFSSASWFEAVKRGAIAARPSATPIAELLVADTYRGRFSLKLRLLREGLKQNCCERCGLTEWRDEPLTLALHHINGQRDANRLENLQLLCPNCHSQTKNYAGRNGNRRAAESAKDATQRLAPELRDQIDARSLETS